MRVNYRKNLTTTEEVVKVLEYFVINSKTHVASIEDEYYFLVCPGKDVDFEMAIGFSVKDVHISDVMTELQKDGYRVSEPRYAFISGYYRVELESGITLKCAKEKFREKYQGKTSLRKYGMKFSDIRRFG